MTSPHPFRTLFTTLAFLVACAAWPTGAAAQTSSTGILVLAHGGAKNWNQGDADAASEV
jgi:hypothetical protein